MNVIEFKQILARVHVLAKGITTKICETAGWPEIDFDPDDSGIDCRFETPRCGCCPGDYDSFSIPYNWLDILTDEQITSRILDEREKKRLAAEAAAKLEKEKQVREREERDKQQYLKLKQKYEGD